MPLRRKTLLAASLLVGGLVLLLYLWSERVIQSRTYQDRGISEWALQLLSPSPVARHEAARVFHTLGKRAEPELRRMLHARDSRVRSFIWAKSASIPGFLRRPVLLLTGIPRSTTSHLAAAQGLALIGAGDAETRDALIKALEDPSTEVRLAALNAGSTLTDAPPLLLHGLANSNSSVRFTALYLIGESSAARTNLADVIARLGDPDEQVRVTAARIIADLARQDASAQPTSHPAGEAALDFARNPLLSLMSDPSPAVRQYSLEALGALRSADEPLIALFCQALRDPEPKVRFAAVSAIFQNANTAASAVPSLVAALGDSHPDIRSWAVATLARIGPEAASAVPHLQSLLQDPDDSVRAAAAQALSKLK